MIGIRGGIFLLGEVETELVEETGSLAFVVGVEMVFLIPGLKDD